MFFYVLMCFDMFDMCVCKRVCECVCECVCVCGKEKGCSGIGLGEKNDESRNQ